MNSFAKLCHRKTVFLLSMALIAGHVAPAFAQQRTPGAQASPASSDKKFDLTIDNIMRGAALTGYEPNNLRWSADGQHLYFQWKQYTEAREKEPETYAVNRDGSGLRKRKRSCSHASRSSAKSRPTSRTRFATAWCP